MQLKNQKIVPKKIESSLGEEEDDLKENTQDYIYI